MLLIDFIGFIIEYFRAAVPAAIMFKCRNEILTSLSAPQYIYISDFIENNGLLETLENEGPHSTLFCIKKCAHTHIYIYTRAEGAEVR